MSGVAIVLFSGAGWDRAAQGVTGAGQRLASDLGVGLDAVVVGAATEEFRQALAGCADRVVVLGDVGLAEYQPEVVLAALTEALASGYRAVLFGNDTYSQELVPRLAHRLGGSSMADGQTLSVVGDKVRVQRSAYGGKAVATYELRREPAVIWVRSRAIEPGQSRGSSGPVEEVSVTLPEPKIKIVERIAAEQQGVKLEDAKVIVSGGRGLGGPDPFLGEVHELAVAMSAEQGASRAACDAGWVPPNWQVGQTGKKVAPELYLAIAISGASQHLLGMGDSKTIAAINTDPDAPIFKHCSFGIVEDYKKVVPLLTEKLRALRQA